MDLISIVGLTIGLIVVVVITSVTLINFDLMSYTATGIETLSPAGTSSGHALVVYNPGVTGAAKNAATGIANNLKSQGYNVTLAGVRNAAATSTSDYDIIIAGGPMYFGKVSRSIETYLKTLTPQNDTKLGVFATTGSSDFIIEDMASLENQVASLQSGKKVTIKLIRDRDEKKATEDCEGLVSAMIQ